MIEALLSWLNEVPIWVLGTILFTSMMGAAIVGRHLRKRADSGLTEEQKKSESQESYIVSAVLGLLALLMGFTLSIALDRFDSRRVLVMHEANAIGTTYLRVQLLGEPHRTRLSKLLVDYTDNRIVLAKAHREEALKLVVRNDQLLTDIWTATAAAFDSVSNLDFSSSLLETTNELIDLDASRKASRAAHVPTEIFVVLLVYLLVTAGVLGHVLVGVRGQVAGGFLLILLTCSLLLIIDIDRPTMGGIRESQGPMEALRATLKKQPPEVFDRWRENAATPAP